MEYRPIFSVDESVENYRQLVDHSPDAIAVHCNGKLVFVNPAAVALLGANEPAELIGKSLNDIVYPDDHETVFPRIKEAIPRSTPLLYVEGRFVRLDGSIVMVEVASMPTTFRGKPAYQVVVRDITDRKQAEVLQEAIYKVSQATYNARSLEQLYLAVHEIIGTVMPADNFYIALYDEINQTISFPYTVDEVDKEYPSVVPLAKGMTEYVLRSGQPLFCDQATLKRLLKRGEIERLGTPSLIWLGVPLVVDEKTIGVMAVQHYRDPRAYSQRDLRMLEYVSHQVAMAIKRKQTDDALSESEKRFRSMFENITIGLYRLTPDGRFLFANPAFVKMLGCSSFDELACTDLEHNNYFGNKARSAFYQALEKNGEIRGWESKWKRSDGDAIYVRENARLVRGDDGGVLFYEGTVEDVSNWKLAELALKDSEESFRTLFENVPDGIYRSLPDDHLLAVNPALANMLGYESASDLIGLSWREMYAEPLVRDYALEVLMRDGRIRHYEVVLLHRDGHEITCLDNALAVRNEAGDLLYFEGVITDVSAQKKTEQALWQRIAALQTLAEIDRAILSADDPEKILKFVCRSAAVLLDAPKALVVSLRGRQVSLDSYYGLTGQDAVEKDFPGSYYADLISNSLTAVALGWIGDTGVQVPIEGVEAMAYAPFDIEATGTRGILYVCDTHRRDWGEDQAQLLKLLAGQVAIGLEKTRLFNDLKARAGEFSALYDLALDLTGQHEVQKLLVTIVDHAMKLLVAPCAFVYLYDSSDDDLVLSFCKGAPVPSGIRLEMGEGEAGRVALTRRPLFVEDYSNWEFRSEKFKGFTFTSSISVPMLYGGELVGVLSVSLLGPGKRAFSEDETRLLYLFAAQAAGTLFSARLFTEISRSNQELDRLYRATGALIASVSSDLVTLAETITSTVMSDFQQSNCALWLVNETGNELKRMALAGLFTEQTQLNELFVDGGGIIPRTIRTGMVANIRDVLIDSDYKVGWPDARSELCIPLEVNGRVIGALDLQSTQAAAFSDEDERLMVMFATRAALMLDHARLLEQTERRLQRLTVLRTIETAIASSLDVRITLNILLEQITSRLNVDAAAVFLLDPNLQTLNYAAGRGFMGRAFERASLRVGQDFAGTAVLDHTLIGVLDLSEIEIGSAHMERIAGERFVTYYCAPLITKGQVKGILELYYRARFDPDPEWPDFIETLARQAAVAIDDASMFAELQKSYTDLMVAYDTSIEVWSRALDMRENEPAGHAQRITDLSLRLAREMGLDEAMLPHIYRGALLHDIGQLSIPDSILLKPGPLTPEEWKIMREHPTRAYEMLFPVVYLHQALNIPYCHHEHWDGNGYPRGLEGEEIPIEARIFSVVDTWDALCTDRPQRPAWREEDALLHIRQQSGKQFDPAVVDAFLRIINETRWI